MAYLVFDIETIPDTAVWTPSAPKARARKTDGDPFPPLYAHRPVAIGVLLLNDDLSVHFMTCAGPTNGCDDERTLLTAWSSFITQQPELPTLVSYNGRAFDLPVLALRSFRHAIPQPWYCGEYVKRYGESHLDLFEKFTEYGLVQRTGFSLDTMAMLIGLPPKGEIDGTKVASLYAQKRFKEIELYCLSDVVKTSLILMRYLLVRGRITVDEYRARANALFNMAGANSLNGVVFSADLSRLLLQAPSPVVLSSVPAEPPVPVADVGITVTIPPVVA